LEAAEQRRTLADFKPPRRGFEPFHKYFSPESSDYPFKPNMKLVFALMPYLPRKGAKYPSLVLCPMAGVGAAPIMVLSYYRPPHAPTRVITWENDEKWRRVLEENLKRNWFCQGRWTLQPIEQVPDETADGAIACIPPDPDMERFVPMVSRLLKTLHSKLMKKSRLIIVSKRYEIDLDETLYTELILEQLSDPQLYNLVEVATVRGRTPQRRLYNKEAQKDVFLILERK